LKNINQTLKKYMGMNIYSILDFFLKKRKKTSSFGILKTKKNGKIGGKQKKCLGKKY
jgi:hypothetical protein